MITTRLAAVSIDRTQSRKTLSVESFEHQMAGLAWKESEVAALHDEATEAYKPIDVVMRDQDDLVRIEHEFQALANYKDDERQRKR